MKKGNYKEWSTSVSIGMLETNQQTVAMTISLYIHMIADNNFCNSRLTRKVLYSQLHHLNYTPGRLKDFFEDQF